MFSTLDRATAVPRLQKHCHGKAAGKRQRHLPLLQQLPDFLLMLHTWVQKFQEFGHQVALTSGRGRLSIWDVVQSFRCISTAC